jgi:hypothetical protein
MNFNGYLNLQKEHLLDLGKNSKLGEEESAEFIQTISNKLDNVADKYKETDTTTRDILTHQDEVTDMVNTEAERLATKKKNIDDALDGQKRMIMLNESYRMKYSHYLKIVLTVLTITILFVIIKFLSTKLVMVPGPVWDLVLIIVFALGLIYIYMVFSDMQRRDNMNFNKLFFMAPSPEDASTKAKLQKGGNERKSNLLQSFGFTGESTCKGDDCCDGSDLQYNSDTNTCQVVQSFGNIGTEGSASVNDLVKPTDPDEYSNYGKYL